MADTYAGQPCLCGCGRLLPPSKSRRPRRYIQGHNPKNWERTKDARLCSKSACQRRHNGGLFCAVHQEHWESFLKRHPNADISRWRRSPGKDYMDDWRKRNW